jgi:hypothetical protein
MLSTASVTKINVFGAGLPKPGKKSILTFRFIEKSKISI